MNFNEVLVLLRKFKPVLFPLFVGISSAIFFYLQTSRYSRFKPRDGDDSKLGNKNNDLVVSVYANEMILSESDFSVITENLNTFLSICSKTRAYLIVKVPDESVFENILSTLEGFGAFKNGLSKHRVMFCQFPNGRISMVQQLQPHLHVELNAENVEFVKSKLIRQNVTTIENMESMLNERTDKSPS